MRERTDYIVIHTAATPPSMDIGAKEIREWHLARGWSDIGYHWVIRRNGTVEPGRPVDAVGAHAKGFNKTSVGICLVGGLNADGEPDCNYTWVQWPELEALVIKMKAKYPDAAVLGHRDLPGVTKTCPVFDADAWWAA